MATLSDQWPLLLAGPILRRVEPELVAVWVALKEPRVVRLSVWQGIIDAGGGMGIFEGPAPLSQGITFTRRVGDHLNVALVVARPKAPLLPGTLYAYNMSLAKLDPTLTPEQQEIAKSDLSKFKTNEDLKSLGMLLPASGLGLPHEPLGYQPGFLPTFATAPADLEDLRILHGSCRRIGLDGNDGLSWIDDLILAWFADPNHDARTRPHQMFHTGDQIYADDVPVSFLAMINEIGRELIGTAPADRQTAPPREHVPTRYPFIMNPVLVDAIKDPLEKAAAQDNIKLAKELFNADPAKAAEALKRRMEQAKRLNDPCQIIQLSLLASGLVQQDSNVVLQRDPGIPVPEGSSVNLWPADLLHFPAGLRTNLMNCEAKFTSGDVSRTVGHLISVGEYCAMYLLMWSNACWSFQPAAKQTDPPAQPTLPDLKAVFDVPETIPQIWELHMGHSHKPAGAEQKTRDDLKTYREDKGSIKDNEEQLKNITRTFTVLPKVRRALANIANYMVFDDHEMTDDWNMNEAWKIAVEAAPFARAVMRNGFIAYTLFQGWGNVPDRFTSGPYKELLDQIEKLFPPFKNIPPNDKVGPDKIVRPDANVGPAAEPAAAIEKLLALRGEEPQLRWHYAVQGPRHIVVVLDQRTRRGFRTRFSAPGLLSATALREQIPSDLAHAGDTADPSQAQQPLPAGIEMLLVVAQTPALLPSTVTSLLVPIRTRVDDLSHHDTFRNMTGLNPDGEIWPADDTAFEDLLARLAFYKRVVLLSGDVHMGFAASLTYWNKTDQKLFDAGAGLAARLNASNRQTQPGLLATLRDIFAAHNRPLSDQLALSTRRGGEEWLLADHGRQEVFLMRLEGNALQVYLDPPPARIAQFTSSGMKNTIPIAVTIGPRLGFAAEIMNPMPLERLGWHSDQPPPVIVPGNPGAATTIASLLRQTPLVIPTRGWPVGTRLASQPDFAWRMLLAHDERPEEERPEAAQTRPLPAEFDTRTLLTSYAQLAARHATNVEPVRHSRTIVYRQNLGKVYFERKDGGLVAVQELLTDSTDADLFEKPFAVAIYRVPLDVFDEERPKLTTVAPEQPQESTLEQP